MSVYIDKISGEPFIFDIAVGSSNISGITQSITNLSGNTDLDFENQYYKVWDTDISSGFTAVTYSNFNVGASGLLSIRKTITYIPTIAELNILYNNTIGQKYKSKVNGEFFYILEVPPLEDILRERDVIKIYGKNKVAPYYTLWSSPESDEFKNYLEVAETYIF